MPAFDILAAVITTSLVIAWVLSRGHSVSHIKGPTGGEWLVGEFQLACLHEIIITDLFTLGHEYILTHQKEAVDVNFKVGGHS